MLNILKNVLTHISIWFSIKSSDKEIDMRQVEKRWYVVRREFNIDGSIRQEDFEGSFETKEEAIAKARMMWDYLTGKEQQKNSIHVCMWNSVQDENNEWNSVMEDDEEYEDGMSYAGAYDIAFEISSDGEHDLFTFEDLY